ncbi:MAG TPA: hypothetical protein PLX97_04395 [Gemmatales bacterium]|nr:hypothetical protein [Gemmatales bacterium]
MTRRFDESLLVGTPNVAQTTPCLPGFVACCTAAVPMGVQQFWQALYQAAYAQAIMQNTEQPTKYQRLMYQVCMN